MADSRFFVKAGPFTLAELALRSGAELSIGANPSLLIHDVAPLDKATADQVSFLDNRKYVESFAGSHAGAVLVRPEWMERAPAGMALLLSHDPYRAYAKVAQAFYPSPPPVPGIAPSSHVDPQAILGEGVCIEAGAVIGAKAEIGARCRIAPNAVIGDSVVLGNDSIVGANASISHAIIGSRVIIFPGAQIGQDGFGFAMGAEGHLKVPQLGRVMIGDDVEIGANTTIDRGAGPDTVIGTGCRIDNLVQIGHNVHLGRGCVLVAQVGISGSTHLGDFVVIAGQVGIAGHLHIGDGVRVAAQSGIMRDVPSGIQVGGSPALPFKEWMRQIAVVEQLTRKSKSSKEEV